MTVTIALSKFNECSFLKNIATRLDDNNNFDNKLNGVEVSLFTTELEKKGINLDFSKLDNSEYLKEINNKYNENLDKKFKDNKIATKLIEKYKNKYDIKEYKAMNSKGSYESYYLITPKQSVKPSNIRTDLRIAEGVISANNSGYGKYDNGTYIENNYVKNPIKIPASELGANLSIRDTLFGI